jgi:nicotinic acid phosphoribosyltransferase
VSTAPRISPRRAFAGHASASGTHAHAFVTSFTGNDELTPRTLAPASGARCDVDFVALVQQCRAELGFDRTNSSELLAFAAYALAFPDGFLALVDTYDTLESGVPNFLAVALALHRLGRRAARHPPRQRRPRLLLESGARKSFVTSARFAPTAHYFGNFTIVASNDINEASLRCARASRATRSTCLASARKLVNVLRSSPALGCVYKLVEVDGQAAHQAVRRRRQGEHARPQGRAPPLRRRRARAAARRSAAARDRARRAPASACSACTRSRATSAPT